MFNLVVLIDLKKAFDTVDHQILLSKLELYGIKAQALNLLKSYLTNRKQKCQIKNVFSSERLIKCGVPQGSILGPLLFLLYINDLPHCLKAAVNSDLENLRKWLIANKLSLNVAKTQFIIIGSKSMTKNISNPHPSVFIENKQIKQVYECKTLGVKIDQHLSWKGNTDEIRKKVSAGISAIRRIIVNRNTDMVRKAGKLQRLFAEMLRYLFVFVTWYAKVHTCVVSSSLQGAKNWQ